MTERDIFLAAVEFDSPAERTAYLDGACRGDSELRRRIDALIRSHEQVQTFLRDPVLAQIDGSDPVPWPNPDQFAETLDASAGAPSLDFLDPARHPGSLGRLGHYEIREVIGRGGMGVVLKAFDESLHRVVAIKVLSPQFATSGIARRRFVREAHSAAAVVHDHVITIHGIDETTPYLVMQYVGGQSLQEKIDRTGPLGVKEILRIGQQIAEGLAAAHAQGLIHRDVKPSNILLENGVERVKITDFGLARAVDDASLTQTGAIAGTPQYMSPEQAEGHPTDHRGDLFSLGSVLYAMCTGRAPFRASSTPAILKRVCEETPRPIREVNDEIPQWLCNIISKLHAKDPAARFATAAEVADVLRRYLAHLHQPKLIPPPPPVAAPTMRSRRRRRKFWTNVFVVVCLLSAGALVVTVRNIQRLRKAESAAADRAAVWAAGTDLTITCDDPTVTVSVERLRGTPKSVIENARFSPTDGGRSITRTVPIGRYVVVGMRAGVQVFREEINLTHGAKREVRVAP